jgi:hypothetical protein
MTSEICLMNQRAVVFGADSAVTMGGDRGPWHYQTGIDKIYILNEAGPIAAMVCGAGSFGAIPWANTFDQFKISFGNNAYPMDFYRKNIIAFLSDVSKYANLKVSEDEEVYRIYHYCYAFIMEYGIFLRREGWAPGRPLSNRRGKAAIDRFKGYLESQKLKHVQSSDRIEDFLDNHLGGAIQNALSRYLDGVEFPEKCVVPLAELVVQSIYLEWIPYFAKRRTAQIVVAGYGRDRLTPETFSVEILYAFGGILKYRARPIDSIEHNYEKSSHFSSYAQDHAVRAMLYGIVPQMESLIDLEATNALAVVFNKIRDLLPDLPEAKQQEIDFWIDLALSDAADQAIRVSKREFTTQEDSALSCLIPQIDVAPPANLTKIGRQLMELVIAEASLAQNHGVSGPITILTMTPGKYELMVAGEHQ